MNINDKLLELRKNKNMSQEDVANKLNVSRQTVSKWETGESKPDLDKVMPICELFGITPDELLTGSKKEIVKNISENKNALVISMCVLMYFIAIVWIIIADSMSFMNENISVSIFLLICAVPTCTLIYNSISKNHDEKEHNKEENKYEKIDDILAIITLIVYLIISFITSCWYITWIIWIVYIIICEIIHTILDMKEGKNK